MLMEELMKQYNQVNSGELKNLSTLLLEILIMDDPLQGQRLKYIIDDSDTVESEKEDDLLASSSNNSSVHGLLTLVKNNQITDSRRSYQCIKTLVNAANKSPAVKEKLLQDPEKWQWAVNWLKSKMSQGGGMQQISTTSDVSSAAENSNYWTTSGSEGLTSLDVISNEDATSTRTFHRTTSAQVILEEANALLAEFGDATMADNDNSVLMASLTSHDKSSLQVPSSGQQQYDASSISPASSPSYGRQLAVVPDIDPEIGSSSLDQMDTDSCEADNSTASGVGQKIDEEEDSEMPDLTNDTSVKISSSACAKNKIRTTPRNLKGTNREGSKSGGESSEVVPADANKTQEDWDFDAVA